MSIDATYSIVTGSMPVLVESAPLVPCVDAITQPRALSPSGNATYSMTPSNDCDVMHPLASSVLGKRLKFEGVDVKLKLSSARRPTPSQISTHTDSVKTLLVALDGQPELEASLHGYLKLPLHRRRLQRPKDTPRHRKLLSAVGSLMLLACIIVVTFFIPHPLGPVFRNDPPSSQRPSAGRNPAYLISAKNGAVASENGICSNIGVDVLKEGGNAVDSAIAVTLCIGVVNLFSSVPSSSQY